jgi:cytochrome c-type biogenesis protein CcmE
LIVPYRRFLFPALAAVAAITVALVVTTLDNNLTYYLTPSEAVSERAVTGDVARFRLGGLVVTGTLHEDGAVLVFDVTDGAETITVRLNGSAPPLFAENVGVVVEGHWSGGVFAADLALVRHDENYQAPTTSSAT